MSPKNSFYETIAIKISIFNARLKIHSVFTCNINRIGFLVDRNSGL
jgi:hypothetical protein